MLFVAQSAEKNVFAKNVQRSFFKIIYRPDIMNTFQFSPTTGRVLT